MKINLGTFKKKLNVQLTEHPATSIFCIYTGKMKVHIHIETCTQMFLAILFAIKNKKQKKTGNNSNVIQEIKA